MENASKALIIVSEVLIGILIISIGVTLFRSFSDFGKQTTEQMDQAKIDDWNSNFLKYYGNVSAIGDDGKEIQHPICVTAHDIVTVANFARQYNISREHDPNNAENNDSGELDYVQVVVKNYSNNFETDLYNKIDFLKNNTLRDNQEDIRYFKCLKYKISEATKKVCYIEFQEFIEREYNKL